MNWARDLSLCAEPLVLIADCKWQVSAMLKAREWPKTSRKQRSGLRLQPHRALLERSSLSVFVTALATRRAGLSCCRC